VVVQDACQHGDLEKVKDLLVEDFDVNEADEDGYTPTMIAATRGYANIVEYLITQRGDPNLQVRLGGDTHGGVPSELEGQTALHMAAQFGRMDVISALLLNGCDASIKDDGGWDAAQLAESEEQTEARFILEDWAENESATRAKLEQESVLKKAEAGTASMASEIRSEMEKMVKDMMAPMQDDIDALRAEMDSLADKLNEESERSEKAQSEILADLDALSGKVVTQGEFDELADRATASLQSDLGGVKSRLNDLTRRVGAMQMEGLQAGFESLGSPR